MHPVIVIERNKATKNTFAILYYVIKCYNVTMLLCKSKIEDNRQHQRKHCISGNSYFELYWKSTFWYPSEYINQGWIFPNQHFLRWQVSLYCDNYLMEINANIKECMPNEKSHLYIEKIPYKVKSSPTFSIIARHNKYRMKSCVKEITKHHNKIIDATMFEYTSDYSNISNIRGMHI